MAIRISFDSCMEGSTTDNDNFGDAVLVTRALGDKADKLREEARDLLRRGHRTWGRAKLAQARRCDELIVHASWGNW